MKPHVSAERVPLEKLMEISSRTHSSSLSSLGGRVRVRRGLLGKSWTVTR
ncbi:hypothetical protein AB0P17_41685 [Streptomyces sp. NPDC088124]